MTTPRKRRMRGAALAGTGLLAVLTLAALLASGCGRRDETLPPAPPPAPGANAPPPVERTRPRPKLPPLVGKDGKPTGGGAAL